MAKTGATTPTLQPSPILPMPQIQVKDILAEHTRQTWHKQWSKHTPCRQTKLWFPSTDRSLSHTILCHTRQEVGLLIPATTGHNHLQYHRHNIDLSVDPTCTLCQQADKDSNHVIRDCTAIVALRQQYFGEDYLESDWAWRPVHLLSF
jgi:hypothetical protein